MKTENYPIVKVLLPYVLGILIAYFGDFPDTVCRLLLWSSVAAVLLTAALTFVRTYRWRVIQTIVMNLAFVTMGISLTNWHFHPHKSPVSIESEKDWMCPEAAYVKAVLAYNLSGLNSEEFMRHCVFYEIVGQKITYGV